MTRWRADAASARGVVEDAIMKICDFAFAFPALLLAILLTATYGPGVVNAIVAIGISNAPIFAKLTRSAATGVLSSAAMNMTFCPAVNAIAAGT